MLLDQDPRGKNFGCVILVHRHLALRNDRSAIQSFIDEVYRTTAHLCPLIQRLLLSVQPGKQRQQAGMNIQDAAAISLNESAESTRI